MESTSENDSELEFSDSSSEDEREQEANTVVNRLWTRILSADTHQYPHQLHEFDRRTGPTNPPNPDAKPVEYFRMFTEPPNGTSLLQILVDETNRYAEQHMSTESYHPKPNSRTNEWYETNISEMSAFLGLYLSMGIVKKHSIESYWNSSEDTFLVNTPGFYSVMRRDRFQLLLKFLHCNDNTCQIARGQQGHDPSHKFRPILDLVNKTFKDAYNPARDLTIDESMVGFKGRHEIVQYVPGKKSHRWGAKFFVLAESDTGYNLTLQLYAGRQGNDDRSGNGVGYDVCMRLIEPYLDRYHHLVVDNYFSSPSLCSDLYDRRTYMTGTVRTFRKGMPRSLHGIRLRKGEREVRQSQSIMAMAYGDRRTVTFLSTMASPRMTRTNNSRGVELVLPEVNDLYNRKMGGVDLSDKAIQLFDPDTRTNKLWKRIFINILLRIMNNAYIVYRQTRGLRCKMPRLDFYLKVYVGLIGDFHQERHRPGPPSTFSRLTDKHFIDLVQESEKCVKCVEGRHGLGVRSVEWVSVLATALGNFIPSVITDRRNEQKVQH